MKIVEGIGTIPAVKWSQTCRVCKGSSGACVGCQVCHASGKFFYSLVLESCGFGLMGKVHVGCAHKAGWTMGFDIQPVKGSRRELVIVVKLGNEQGAMTAAVWCPEHDVKSTVHQIGECTEETGLVWL